MRLEPGERIVDMAILEDDDDEDVIEDEAEAGEDVEAVVESDDAE
jgi:hypothetical protein